jgi:hypothetical protein
LTLLLIVAAQPNRGCPPQNKEIIFLIAVEAKVIHQKTIIISDHNINYQPIFQDLTISKAIFPIIQIRGFTRFDHY